MPRKSEESVSAVRGPSAAQRKELAALARRPQPAVLCAGVSMIIAFALPLTFEPGSPAALWVRLLFSGIALVALITGVVLGAPFRKLRDSLGLTARSAAEIVKAERNR